jgi:GWxTD domain-containing protein
MEVTASESDSLVGATVYISLVRSSLTFFRTPSGFRAGCGISVRALEVASEKMLAERLWTDTLEARSYEESRMSTSVRLTRQMAVQPGSCIIEVEVEDRQSGKTLTHRQLVNIPDIKGINPVLGRLLLFPAGENGSREPLAAFHIPLGADSMRYSLTAYNLSAWRRVRITTLLEKFVLDSTAAVPPFSYSSRLLDMEGRRLFPSRSDTLMSRVQNAVDLDQRFTVRGELPPLRFGMYRFTVNITQLDSAWHPSDSSLSARRYFVAMRRSFPRPSALEEMKQMVRYIATDDEMRALDSAATDEESRVRFEHFWMGFGDDRTAASNLIRTYYSRIEEANLLFSSFKEGWKTDRGMLYIVLGPPEYIERKYQEEIWYYSYSGTYQENIFQFRHFEFATQDLSLDDYVLTRSMQYQVFWDRRISKWREGQIF